MSQFILYLVPCYPVWVSRALVGAKGLRAIELWQVLRKPQLSALFS